jgi:hypothetical protein
VNIKKQKILQIIVLVLFCISIASCKDNTNRRDEQMNEQDLTTLRNSQDPDAVCQAALQIANGNNPDGLRLLAQKLGNNEFLSILDSEQDYQSSPETLNVTGILETLAENPAPTAKELLTQLTQNPVFLANLSRVEMLILACASLRPVPEPVLKFWIQQTGPESSSTPLVVEALFTNGTEPAMKLFENLMNNPSYSDSDKTFWLRSYAVPHRDDLYFLQAAERAIQGNAEKQTKFEWIRTIFDYKAGWYPPRDIPTPPDPMLIQPQSKQKLLSIGNYALSLSDLPEDLKIAVESRLKMYNKNENQ